jgi:hypothetical protein
MRGGSIVKLQAILSHSSVRTTQIYARLAPDHVVGATGILEGLGAVKPAEINARSTHGAVAFGAVVAARA